MDMLTPTDPLGVSVDQVRQMVEAGTIKGAEVNGEIIVREKSIKEKIRHPKVQPIKHMSGIRREDLPEYQQYAYLQGKPIWASESARKYNVIQQNISRWVKFGIIKQVGVDKNRILLDEQDVAYCAFIYHQHNGQRGRWLFRPDGTPYEYRDIPKQAPTVVLAAE
jgi:hypothetical protein